MEYAAVAIWWSIVSLFLVSATVSSLSASCDVDDRVLGLREPSHVASGNHSGHTVWSVICKDWLMEKKILPCNRNVLNRIDHFQDWLLNVK